MQPDDEIRAGAQLLICKVNMYGLMARCVNKDRRSGNFKVAFDKSNESAKVHDPFMGRKAIEAH